MIFLQWNDKALGAQRSKELIDWMQDLNDSVWPDTAVAWQLFHPFGVEAMFFYDDDVTAFMILFADCGLRTLN